MTERGLTAKEILNICVLQDVPPRKVCHTVPQGVQETAMFVIDLQDIDERDLTADGNGIYKRHSSPTELVTAEVESSRIRSVKKLAKRNGAEDHPTFEIKRHYSWHSSSQEFRCTVIKLIIIIITV